MARYSTLSRGSFVAQKSSGEKKLLTILNGNSSLIAGNVWNNKRAEFVQHFAGWPFVAIDAVASEIAGMSPHYAYRVDKADQSSVQKSMVRKMLGYSHGAVYGKNQRKKALTGLQDQIELEKVSLEHPLVRLNDRPNPIDVAWTYWYKVVMYLGIIGEAYIWDVPNEGGIPKESWVMPSQWMFPMPSESRMIDYYEVRPISTWLPSDSNPGNWFWFGGGGGKFKIPAEQIIPFFCPSPHTLVGGFSPIGASSAWVDCSDNIDKSRVFKFQNDAFPSVAVVFDKDIDPDTITQPQIDRLKAMIKEKYTGVRRTGEPAVLGPGMSLQILSSTPRDMDYIEGHGQLRDSLMAVHRTGPIVVGMSNETTHAAGRAARAGWHASTITPKVKMMGQVVTEHRCRKFDETMVCFWMDSAPEDVEFEHTQRMDFMDRDMMTLNEGRAQAGLENHPDDELGTMTLSQVKAKIEVPKGIGEGAPLDSLGEETELEGQSSSRMDHIFRPSINGNGNGNGKAALNDKMKALTDLRNEFLIAKD